jgi:glycine dehydrogenase subunit 2
MMIEPTETETPETLDRFAAVMNEIDQQSLDDPGAVRSAPHFTPVGRLDETAAARRPDLVWEG